MGKIYVDVRNVKKRTSKCYGETSLCCGNFNRDEALFVGTTRNHNQIMKVFRVSYDMFKPSY